MGEAGDEDTLTRTLDLELQRRASLIGVLEAATAVMSRAYSAAVHRVRYLGGDAALDKLADQVTAVENATSSVADQVSPALRQELANAIRAVKGRSQARPADSQLDQRISRATKRSLEFGKLHQALSKERAIMMCMQARSGLMFLTE